MDTPTIARTDRKLSPLARKLRAFIEADGRKHEEIARVAGIHRNSLCFVLTGTVKAPSVDTLERILRALGKSWKDLD